MKYIGKGKKCRMILTMMAKCDIMYNMKAKDYIIKYTTRNIVKHLRIPQPESDMIVKIAKENKTTYNLVHIAALKHFIDRYKADE